jgi:hypothetical protein
VRLSIVINQEVRENAMISRNNREKNIALAAADPYSGSSLVPMLISGLVFIVVAMIAVAAFS